MTTIYISFLVKLFILIMYKKKFIEMLFCLYFRCCVLRKRFGEIPRSGQDGPGHQGEATNRNAADRRNQDEESAQPLTHTVPGCKF